MITLAKALKEFEEIANRDYDGHFSILKFTTGYKAFFGTAQMDFDNRHYREVFELPTFPDMTTAIVEAIDNEYEIS